MGSVFRPITRLPLFKKVIKEIGSMTGGAATGSAAPAAPAAPAATKPADKPSAGTETTAAITEARQRAGRRRARRTGGMRLLMSQGNAGGEEKKTKLGPGQ